MRLLVPELERGTLARSLEEIASGAGRRWTFLLAASLATAAGDEAAGKAPDRQDQTLARPSQLEACARKAAELAGEIVVEFFDHEYERKKLSRETKRGMRENALQGFRCCGCPPYG